MNTENNFLAFPLLGYFLASQTIILLQDSSSHYATEEP
jgi:hypothetical protein